MRINKCLIRLDPRLSIHSLLSCSFYSTFAISETGFAPCPKFYSHGGCDRELLLNSFWRLQCTNKNMALQHIQVQTLPSSVAYLLFVSSGCTEKNVNARPDTRGIMCTILCDQFITVVDVQCKRISCMTCTVLGNVRSI